MLTVVCWKWGRVFGAKDVNRLRAALAENLYIPHRVVCVTDDPRYIDPRVRTVALPEEYRDSTRCKRRMQVFSRDFARGLGERILTIDLDVVIVGDLTPILNRHEPIVCWKVKHAGVYSGSFHLMDAGMLDALWQEFRADPEGTSRAASGDRDPSDQAMLNHYLRGRAIPYWTEADGFVTYFGQGYASREHLGVGPNRHDLPAGARIVVLGSADLAGFRANLPPWAESWR